MQEPESPPRGACHVKRTLNTVNRMDLTRIAGTCKPAAQNGDDDPPCGEGDCPTIYTTPTGSIAVQGYVLDHAVPAGEGIVEIPENLLLEAVRALGR